MKKHKRLVYTVIAIFLGILIGSIILKINHINPLKAYKVVFFGAIGKPKYISWTIVQAVPIVLTGLSVAFAFQTGLFNIGAEGQYIVGTIGALVVGLLLPLPPIIHPIVCLIFGAFLGAVWGGLVGFFKARFKVNEVISSIMLNWIAFYFSNYILSFAAIKPINSDNSYNILPTASIRILGKWKTSDAGIEFLSQHKILKEIFNAPVHWGIFIAVIAAILIWYILKRTTLGYQLKAVGFNSDAAEYAGINIGRNIVTAMGISGLLSGLAGAIMVLAVSENISMMSAQQGYGFSGMAVALIAGNSPIGCIPAGLLYAGLTYGGGKLTTIGANTEIIDIVIGVIILFIAMPKLLDVIQTLIKKVLKGGKPQ